MKGVIRAPRNALRGNERQGNGGERWYTHLPEKLDTFSELPYMS